MPILWAHFGATDSMGSNPMSESLMTTPRCQCIVFAGTSEPFMKMHFPSCTDADCAWWWGQIIRCLLLSALKSIPQSFTQIVAAWRSFKWISHVSPGSLPLIWTVVSSADIDVCFSRWHGRLLTNTRNRVGPHIVPCGLPYFVTCHGESVSLTLT